MSTRRRALRFFWLLGLVLLLGSVAGAGWLLNHAPAGDGTSKDRERPAASGTTLGPLGSDFIISTAHADLEHGLIPVHPTLPGRVTEVWVQEGDEVPEGYLLLRLDDRLARQKLREARAGLAAAQATKAKVVEKQRQHKDLIAGQQEAVEAAKANARAHTNELKLQKELLDQEQIRPEAYRALEEKGKAAAALAKVEERKLAGLRDYDFGPDLRQADANLQAKEAEVEGARLGLTECDVYAPTDGSVLRRNVNQGEVLGKEPRQPAILFCPDAPRIVRAEVLQEFATNVKAGQRVVIEDDARAGPQWEGRVKSVSDWYARRRSNLLEPFQYNDVRTLEAIVSVTPNERPLRIGQRVRVIIRQGGP